MLANEHGLLAKMRSIAGNLGFRASAAQAKLALQPVDVAPART